LAHPLAFGIGAHIHQNGFTRFQPSKRLMGADVARIALSGVNKVV
jgi:hypothetical protein